MSTRNIHFHDKIRKIPLKSQNICFLKLSKEFPRDTKTSSNHPRCTSHPCSSHRGYTVFEILEQLIKSQRVRILRLHMVCVGW